MTFRLTASALLLVGLATACGDGSGPRPFNPAFSLETINGAPPPALVGATITCDEYLDAALLNLFDNGTFTLQAQITFDCTGSGGRSSAETRTVSGRYSRSGSTITLTVPGAAPIAATYSGTGLAATIPASPVTFPNPVDATFLQLLPL